MTPRSRKHIVIILLFCSCSKIKSGKVTFVGFIPPHEETYTTYYWIGKVMYPQTHYRWIPDTTWYINFKNGKKDREIEVSKESAAKFNVGDSLYLND